jgi:PPK2 family polyphosphate:nucleotide phosphotransferase
MKEHADIDRLRVDQPKRFRLAHCDPGDTCRLDIEKADAKELLAHDIKRMAELQQQLWASNRWALLIILQGMDASGKDGVIKHVMSGINPQGCEVHSFKAPSEQELDHDFLWRTTVRLPERGRIGIFNRSYYEEVLAVRVQPELLERQRLPAPLQSKRIWQERFEDIRNFEQHLGRNGTVVLKFMLHISKEEQKRQFLQRLDDPLKHWKFSMGDIAARRLWPRYMAAYENMVRETSTPEAPWHVVPADHKWFARLAVARTIVRTLERLDLQFPLVDAATAQDMRRARRALLAERSSRGRGWGT